MIFAEGIINLDDCMVREETMLINGMLEASKGCLKEEMRMDVISNNLANVSVIGFKKSRISFKDVLAQAGPADAQEKGLGGTGGGGSLVILKTDLGQGDIQSTGNNLDLAISGSGFFKVETPNGVRFTRKGNFQLDSQGNLITQNGYRVLGRSGPISIYGKDVVIDEQGSVFIDGERADQVDVVDFDSQENLIVEGHGLIKNVLDEPGKAPPPETAVRQGYLELSNVNPVEEMVNMIHSLRAFESYEKSMKVLDEMNSKVVNEVGKLR